jgi:hypothetical protein
MNAIQLPLPEPQNPLFGPVIYAYTRAQAVEDGVLADVTETAGGDHRRPAWPPEPDHGRSRPRPGL